MAEKHRFGGELGGFPKLTDEQVRAALDRQQAERLRPRSSRERIEEIRAKTNAELAQFDWFRQWCERQGIVEATKRQASKHRAAFLEYVREYFGDER